MEIKTITIDDENYPKSLKEIANPPKTLYYQGKLPQNDEICFAIVGTRRCSAYGKQITLEIAGHLNEAGFVVVSGLAPGIDTFAHQSAVEKGKRTISVLGTGLNEKSIYPQENLKLARKILELDGCLISEYPPGTPGSRFTFPQRNRIISGLSQGVLVVESKEKGGSLITANFAFSQKRKVFALPGSVYSLNSRGTHNLIKKGAKLVENANDISKELNLENLTSFSKNETIIENPEEKLILDALKEELLYLDKIIEKTKLEPSVVASTLTILEIKGKVRNLGGNTYALKL